jgi:hypothetical protein
MGRFSSGALRVLRIAQPIKSRKTPNKSVVLVAVVTLISTALFIPTWLLGKQV